MSQGSFIKEVEKSPVRLSQDDVRRLLERSDVESRIDVLSKVGSMFSPEQLSPEEMTIAGQIFRLLVQDSALRIRQAMADNLATNPYLPPDVALTLARDVESVATPVLMMSNVLNDEDLHALIQHSEEIWRYVAIARRATVSERLSAVLIETDQPEVMRQLAGNQGARIGETSYLRLVGHAEQDDNLAGRLAARPGLPVSVVQKLLRVVSGELAEKLRDQLPIDTEHLEAGLRHANEEALIKLLAMRTDRHSTIELVRQLAGEGRLVPPLVLNALAHGNIDFFVATLSFSADIPFENAYILAYDKGSLGFKALYNKSVLPPSMLKAVRLLFDTVDAVIQEGFRPESDRFFEKVVERLIALSERQPVENLAYILAILRQPL